MQHTTCMQQRKQYINECSALMTIINLAKCATIKYNLIRLFPLYVFVCRFFIILTVYRVHFCLVPCSGFIVPLRLLFHMLCVFSLFLSLSFAYFYFLLLLLGRSVVKTEFSILYFFMVYPSFLFKWSLTLSLSFFFMCAFVRHVFVIEYCHYWNSIRYAIDRLTNKNKAKLTGSKRILGLPS